MKNTLPSAKELSCRGLLFVLSLLWVSQTALGATFIINNLDTGSGTGFDDATPVAPVTGNPGVTLGAQRLNAFQAAADDWGAILKSPVTIVIDAAMTSLTCGPSSGTLGSAGPNGNIFRNFPGAPAADTFFPQALANSLFGSDLDGGNSDISAQFNRDVDDDPNCLTGLTWSYVVGVNAPAGTIPFTDTVLHEIAHGLGFLTFTDVSNGERVGDSADQYSRFLIDETPAPTGWNDLNNAGRTAAAIDTGQLTWAGPEVDNVDDILTTGRHGISDRTRMYAPNPLEIGSSVSHWDTVLSPDELMEPSATSNVQRFLTNHLMLDIGWHELVQMVVTKTDGLTEIVAGSATSYIVTVTNNGPGAIRVVNATVTDNFMPALLNPGWTCSGTGGATCGNAGGSGNISTTVSIPRGGVATFNIDATVDAGFSGVLTNTATLSMPANLTNTGTVSATDNTTVTSTGSCFALTLNHTGSGISPLATPLFSPGCVIGSYTAGQVVSLNASPSQGWSVGSWSGTDNNSSTSTTNQVTMPGNNHTATVNYSQAPPQCFALTTTHTGSGISPLATPLFSPGCVIGSYNSGQVVSLEAIPSEGWNVGSWNGTDNDGSTSTTNQVTMPGNNHTATVNYSQAPPQCFALTTTHTGSGISPLATPLFSPGCVIGSYNSGQVVSLEAIPSEGWNVGSWNGTDNDGSTSTTNQVTMPASSYTVLVNYISNGGTEPNASLFVPIIPCRLFDTRAQGAGGPFGGGTIRTFNIWGDGLSSQGGTDDCGIPSNAVAVHINFTAVNPTGFGYLRAWPYGETEPGATLMAFVAGPGVSNATALAICTSCVFDINVKIYLANTQLVGEAVGYYEPIQP